jgi:hypothetical protein
MIDIDKSVLESSFPGIGNEGSQVITYAIPSYSIKNFPGMSKVDVDLGPITGGNFIQVQAKFAQIQSKYLVCNTAQEQIPFGADTFNFQFYVTGGHLHLWYYWFASSSTLHTVTNIDLTVQVFFYNPPF